MKKKKRMQVNAILVEDAVNAQSVVVDVAVVVVVERTTSKLQKLAAVCLKP